MAFLKYNKEEGKGIIYWRLCIPRVLGFQISWAGCKKGSKGWYSIKGKECFCWLGFGESQSVIAFIGRLCVGFAISQK